MPKMILPEVQISFYAFRRDREIRAIRVINANGDDKQRKRRPVQTLLSGVRYPWVGILYQSQCK